MADIRELLARLNPTNVRFDTGRGGGAPALTSQDVAAALAMVPRGLGREVLIACWWPDGAKLDGQALAEAVLAVIGTEWRRQGQELQDARMDLAIAEACSGWHGVTTPEQRREVMRARARWDRIKGECWPPELPGMLPALVRTALAEIAVRRECAKCQGHGTGMDGNLLRTCETCAGAGTVPMSDRERAERLGKPESTFRRAWRPCYVFVLAAMREAEGQAAASLSRALRRDEVA